MSYFAVRTNDQTRQLITGAIAVLPAARSITAAHPLAKHFGCFICTLLQQVIACSDFPVHQIGLLEPCSSMNSKLVTSECSVPPLHLDWLRVRGLPSSHLCWSNRSGNSPTRSSTTSSSEYSSSGCRITPVHEMAELLARLHAAIYATSRAFVLVSDVLQLPLVSS